ncbi:AI-2E family transporter [Streptomyces sp. NPDC101733]|uniref:AI-2E family transporter n=1 Tax=unclassified Streptomyces TaxID=2593676 RepID=UPI0037F6A7AA
MTTHEHAAPPKGPAGPGGGGNGRAAPDPSSVLPWGVRVGAEAAWRLVVLAAALWILARVVATVQLVAFSFVVALFATALLRPAVRRLERAGLHRALATALVIVAGFAVVTLIGWFVVWQVVDHSDDVAGRLQEGIHQLRTWALNSPLHVTDQQVEQAARSLSNAVGTNASKLAATGLQGATFAAEFLTGVLLTAFSTLFLVYDGPRVWRWVLGLVPAAGRPAVAAAAPHAWRTLTAYVRGTVAVAFIDGLFIGLGLYLLDVPLAVPLAALVFVCAFVPLAGAVASGALAVLVALVTCGPVTALAVLLVVLAVQQLEGHFLQPFILGRAVRVHPLAVILSVAAGGLAAGVGGAVIAVPLVAVANTMVGRLREAAGAEATSVSTG